MVEYISVGCPVGRLNKEEMQYFFAGGQLLGLNSAVYKTWLCFLGGNYMENVIKNPDLLQDAEPDALRARMEEMAEAGLIIPEDEAEQYVPLREGIGVGYNDEHDCYLIYTNRVNTLDYIAYLIWSYSDGRRKLQDILEQLQKLGLSVTKEEGKQALLALLRKSVLFLSLED